MESNMVFLCEMWKFAANEYMEFLNRYGIENFSVGILFRDTVDIYVNQDKYLQISVNDSNFTANEKHIINLLELIERMVDQSAKIETNNEQIDEMPYLNEDED